MTKTTIDTRIISNSRLTEEYFVLQLQSEADISGIKAGQFVQVRVDGSSSTFLRRPISVYDIDITNKVLSLLIKIAGEGTATLARLKSGDILNLILPLGNSFTIPEPGSRALLIGGGVGVAPLFLLGKSLSKRDIDFSFLLGYRTADQIIEPDKFRSVGDLFITTEDGSIGHKGLVTTHPVITSGGYTHIFCCGPDPMMRGVAALAKKSKIECEVSLENLMACGIGICLCCIENTTSGNVNTCTDGPVFNINKLKWQI